MIVTINPLALSTPTPAAVQALTLIAMLEPFASTIHRAYIRLVDPTPVVGWLAMWCELTRIASKQDHQHKEDCLSVVQTIHRALGAA